MEMMPRMKTVFDHLQRDPTPGEIIDYIQAHLVNQGKRSAEGTSCKYRDGSLSCAVGCLVDDKTAHAWDSMESSNIINVVNNHKVPAWMTDHRLLLKHLQEIHDNSENWNEAGFIGHVTEKPMFKAYCESKGYVCVQ